jgi:hypothetical protein
MAAPQVVPGAAFDALVELVQGLQLPPVEAFHVAEAAVPALEKIAHNYAYAHKKVLDCIASMRSGWSCLASASSFAPSRAVQQSSRGASLHAVPMSPDANLDVAALRSQIEHDNHVIAELQIQHENAKQRIEQLQQQVQELSAECQARIYNTNVFQAAKSGNLNLVKDHVTADASCVHKTDRGGYGSLSYARAAHVFHFAQPVFLQRVDCSDAFP